MPDADATWSPAPELVEQLAGTRFGQIRRFVAVDSTNRYLLAEAARGAGDGVVAVAGVQTAGRGRHGRSWTAAPGAALLVSVLLRPDLGPERLHLVTLAAGIAAAGAVRDVAGFEAGLKWPNDLVVDDRKLAGILAETDGAGAVVVGMGCNLRSDAFPAEIADIATACDRHAAHPVDADALLVAWLHAFDRWLRALDDVVAAAAACSATLGRRVRVERARDAFAGVATEMTAEGYLVVVADDDTRHVVTAGDVVHLRVTDRSRGG